jgi:hypothetical protein
MTYRFISVTDNKKMGCPEAVEVLVGYDSRFQVHGSRFEEEDIRKIHSG